MCGSQNRSEVARTVQASLSAASIYYTGIKAHVIKRATGEFKVAAKSSKYVSSHKKMQIVLFSKLLRFIWHYFFGVLVYLSSDLSSKI